MEFQYYDVSGSFQYCLSITDPHAPYRRLHLTAGLGASSNALGKQFVHLSTAPNYASFITVLCVFNSPFTRFFHIFQHGETELVHVVSYRLLSIYRNYVSFSSVRLVNGGIKRAFEYLCSVACWCVCWWIICTMHMRT